LVDDFESGLKDVEDRIQVSNDINEVISLQSDEVSSAIGDKLIRELMDLTDRDEAERWAANIDVSGLGKNLQRQTVRAVADFYQLIGKDLKVATIRSEADRSYADDTDQSIGLKDGSPKTRRRNLYHELGHHAEFEDTESAKLAVDWVRSRSVGDPE
jgi:hypothetical protein